MATFAHQPAPGQPQRRRIALLHGTAGSEKTLRIQLGPLLPKLQETWDVTFVEAPQALQGGQPARQNDAALLAVGGAARVRRGDGRRSRLADLRELDEAVEALDESGRGRTVCWASRKARQLRVDARGARGTLRGAPYRAVVLWCVVRGRAGRGKCHGEQRRPLKGRRR